MTRTLLIALVAFLVLASSASARTVHEDLADAHRAWGSTVCQGQWQVTPDTLEHRGVRGGAATGIEFIYNPVSGVYADANGRWDWRIARCEFAVNPTLQGCARYYVVLHEMGHFVHGPGHDGAMSPEHVGNAPCPIAEQALRTTRAPKAKRKVKRSRKAKRPVRSVRR